MKLLDLQNDTRKATVDDDDYEKCSQHSWWLDEAKSGKFYVAATISGERTRLHKFLMPDCGFIDHKDGNGLNNQRSNLRPSDYSLNQANRLTTKSSASHSKFRGVTFEIRRGKWKASIRVNYKNNHLGYFPNEELAALAYDTAAKQYFGEHARLNFN